MKKSDVFAVISIICVYSLLMFLGITCPIKWLTGISCGGCGMTRAWLSVLKLNFSDAFKYHPLFLLVLPAGGIFLARKRLNTNIFKIASGVIIVLFIACYLIRLLDPLDQIVVFDPKQGIVWKTLKEIMNRL